MEELIQSFAITDIHGCFKTFMNLLEVMEVKEQDLLINLGDTVDRGPRVKECLEFLMNRKNTINIIGNHDYSFMDYAFNGIGSENAYMLHQGLQTTLDQLGSDLTIYAEFIKSWKTYVKMSNNTPYVFCHSTYPWKDSDKETFTSEHFWERWYDRSKLQYQYYEGPIIVHGHTPTKNPYEIINGKLIGINLDKGAPYNYPWSGLRGMRLSDGKIFEVKSQE